MLVCHHSGSPCQLCEYRCPKCEHSYIACPDSEGIRQACQAIRATWTEAELARAEGRDEPLEIPTATLVWDGMRRNDKGDG
jgi:hypothetical protein